MKVSFKSKINIKEVERAIRKKADLIHKATLSRFRFLGEKLLTHARNSREYMDQTGALTSSMGYVITYNGQVIENSFLKTETDSDREGRRKGQEVALNTIADLKEGYAIVAVAGMSYAIYVEAKGYNVLTSTEIFCEHEFPKMVEQLNKNIDAAFS